MHNRLTKTAALFALTTVLFLLPLPANAAEPQNADVPVAPAPVQDIKAYCTDFNWGARRGFARPGSWCNADPAKHVAWYKAMSVNVIQTFCVSCNGYAWYKNGFVPEQPGLKHDFLPAPMRPAGPVSTAS